MIDVPSLLFARRIRLLPRGVLCPEYTRGQRVALSEDDRRAIRAWMATPDGRRWRAAQIELWEREQRLKPADTARFRP